MNGQNLMLDFSPPCEAQLTLVFTKGPMNVCAYYEGDLAINGTVGAHEFSGEPLNLCYGALLRSYAGAHVDALRHEQNAAKAAAIYRAYQSYCDRGIELHHIAARTVAIDGSRLTTCFGLCCNYHYTLLHVARVALGESQTRSTFVQIDEHLGGMDEWDGLGINWGFEPQTRISRMARTDLSRGRTYNAGSTKESGPRAAGRMEELISLLQGRRIDLQTPSSIYMPLADAVRATPQSIAKILSEGVAQLTVAIKERARELAEARD